MFHGSASVEDLDAFIAHNVAICQVRFPDLVHVNVKVWEVEDTEIFSGAFEVGGTVTIDSPADVEGFPCEKSIGESFSASVVAYVFIERFFRASSSTS